MPKYKAAVIGCGRIGLSMELDPKRIKPATHAGAFKANESTELCALVDIDPAKLRLASELFPSVPTYTDTEKMLDECGPDIVAVSTPTEDHYSSVIKCAERGVKAIICEKPIASNLREAKEMIDVCKKYGCLLFVNHTRRFDPLLNRVRDEIRNGAIGEVIQATAYYTAGLFNTGTHLVDLLRMFLGEVDVAISYKEERTSSPPGDMNVNGWLIFDNNIPVAIQSLEVKDYSIFEVRFFGRKGAITIDRFGFEVEYTPVRECVDFANYRELDVDGRKREGRSRSFMKYMVEHVVNCLDGKCAPISTGEDGMKALQVLIALKKSAEMGGRPISVKELEEE